MNKMNPISAIKDGWMCAKKHFIVSLGLLLAYLVVSSLTSLLPAGISTLLSFFVTLVWSLGIVRISIDVVDGDEPRFGAFREVMPLLVHYLFMVVIMSVLVLVPMFLIMIVAAIACSVSFSTLMAGDLSALSAVSLWIFVSAIPAIYVSIRFFFAPYLMVDRNVSPIEALKMSWKASYPVQFKLLLFFVLAMVVMMLGFICFIVGVLVSMIVLFYAQAALYRQAFPAGLQDPLLVEEKELVVE